MDYDSSIPCFYTFSIVIPLLLYLNRAQKINLQHSSLKNMKQKRDTATRKSLDPK